MVDGNADVYGSVRGNLVTVRGDVVVHRGGVVSGDILTLGGEVRDLGGEIGGEVRTLTPARGTSLAGGTAGGRLPGLVQTYPGAGRRRAGCVSYHAPCSVSGW